VPRKLLALMLLASLLSLTQLAWAASSNTNETATGSAMREIPLVLWSLLLDHPVKVLAWDTSGSKLFIGTSKGGVIVNRAGQVVAPIVENQPIYSASFSPDSRLLVVSAGEMWHYVYVYNMSDGRLLARTTAIHGDLSACSWVTPRYLAVGEAERPRVYIYDWARNTCCNIIELTGRRKIDLRRLGVNAEEGVARIVSIPDTDRFLVATRDGRLAMLSLIAAKPLWVTPRLGHELVDVSVGKDNAVVAAVNKTAGVSVIYLVSLHDGSLVAFYTLDTLVTAVDVLGGYVFAADVNGNLFLFRYAPNGLILYGIRRVTTSSITDMAIDPTGRILVIGTDKNNVIAYSAPDFIYVEAAKRTVGISTLYTRIGLGIEGKPVMAIRLSVNLPAIMALNVENYWVSFEASLEYKPRDCNAIVKLDTIDLRDAYSNKTVAVLVLENPVTVTCSGLFYGVHSEPSWTVHGRGLLGLMERSVLSLLGDEERVLTRLYAVPYIEVQYRGNPRSVKSEITVVNLVPSSNILAKFYRYEERAVTPIITTTLTKTTTATVTLLTTVTSTKTTIQAVGIGNRTVTVTKTKTVFVPAAPEETTAPAKGPLGLGGRTAKIAAVVVAFIAVLAALRLLWERRRSLLKREEEIEEETEAAEEAA